VGRIGVGVEEEDGAGDRAVEERVGVGVGRKGVGGEEAGGAGDRAVEERVGEDRAVEERDGEDRAVEERVGEDRAVEERVGEDRAVEERVGVGVGRRGEEERRDGGDAARDRAQGADPLLVRRCHRRTAINFEGQDQEEKAGEAHSVRSRCAETGTRGRTRRAGARR
jgi:hypothetical protein